MSVCMTALASPAHADVRSYCEAYARNQADVHLTGSAILGAKPTLTPEEWEERKTLALADCLTLYTPKAAEIVAVKPETVTAKKPVLELLARRTSPAQQDSDTKMAALVPGSPAWKDYCAAKYASFNRATDTYTSLSGKQRPCRVTKS